MIVKKEERVMRKNSNECMVYEYLSGSKKIDIALVELSGRYPEKGQSLNKKSTAAVYVASGKGKVTINGKTDEIEEGDGIIINANQKYFFDGKMKLIYSCTPP